MKYPLQHIILSWFEPKLWFYKRFWKYDFEGQDYILKCRLGILCFFAHKNLY